MRRPTARVAFKVQAHDRTRLRIYAWQEDDRVPSPGDLLIVSEIGVAGSSLLEMAILIMGRDMEQLLPAIIEARELYEENREWLSAPVTTTRTA